jgi:hypothetical protein
MSSKSDYFRLFKKPSYEGDFLTQMFDWNLNDEGLDKEATQLEQAIKLIPIAEEETWESLNNQISASKYKAKHDARRWKKALVR